ncbi:hypothetical protein WL515_13510, partial [Staphylococcus lugdunensis]
TESLNDVLPLIDELSESEVLVELLVEVLLLSEVDVLVESLVEILLLSEVEVLVLTESLNDVLPLIDELSESDVLVE